MQAQSQVGFFYIGIALRMEAHIIAESDGLKTSGSGLLAHDS
jgi:hypothetical protein